MIRASEVIAREVIQGQTDEVLGLINPVNDDNLAAWMMAKDRAQRLVGTIQTVCDAISARTPALRSISEFPIRVNSPAEDAAMDAHFAELEAPGIAEREAVAAKSRPQLSTEIEEIEAEQINQAHVDPFFAPALAMVQPPKSVAS